MHVLTYTSTDPILPLPPVVKAVASMVTTEQEKETTLSCIGKYVPRGYSFVYWMFKGQEIYSIEKYSIKSRFYTIRNDLMVKMMVNTSLAIRMVDQTDEGFYTCVVSSHIGTGQQKLQLVVDTKGWS